MTEASYKARYWRYFAEGEEECDSLDEALAYLAWGWEAGQLSEIEIVGPDGSVVLNGGQLFDRMMERLDR
jgi:hypothetical protein